MKKTDEDMLIRFMHEQKEEIKDNGFSHKVMHSLPKRYQWGNRLFNMACILICLYLFHIFNGGEILLHALKEAFASCLQLEFIHNINLPTLYIALGTLIIVGISKSCFQED